MRTTRSSSRTQSTTTPTSTVAGDVKRKLELEEAPKTPTKKRVRMEKPAPLKDEVITASVVLAPGPSTTSQDASAPLRAHSMVPAVLTFSFEDAKKHLISVDHRFQDLFSKMQCKPFEHLETVHPFRDSCQARHTDVANRGTEPKEGGVWSVVFISNDGVLRLTLDFAVLDLAQRFADGRLSTDKLISANDEELAKMLIEVRGIGKWTVDMFAIFSLRRPDILPVGDLGVQRGLVVWFLSLHSSKHTWGWTPQKTGASSSAKKGKSKKAVSAEDDSLPVIGEDSGPSTSTVAGDEKALTPDISSVPPAADEEVAGDLPSLPPAFTPSIKNMLKKAGVDEGSTPVPLPVGLSVDVLKTRLTGKNKIKGAFLTPKEMEDLTEHWKPYRSLGKWTPISFQGLGELNNNAGVYYMWSIADVPS
ncbi:hypothetical protein H0H87_009745 [Tephrocybe sp. NHM501043]|nr:hypothetical protein H0H87_009745 [Tephrocybe sp. NHM501043]